MAKYLAQVNSADGSCFCKTDDSLDAIRTWARQVGKVGETLLVMKNGDFLKNAKTFTL
jgi:hypothetical protein